ncbi:MAG: hypothetical protein IKN24_02295 [Lachnospiraceae bacterium]|nr:hypothetical protein [Lachnospiraceae bacterium]
MNCDAYLFGQVLATHSFLLRGGFLKPDEMTGETCHMHVSPIFSEKV